MLSREVAYRQAASNNFAVASETALRSADVLRILVRAELTTSCLLRLLGKPVQGLYNTLIPRQLM